jgi:hypothetical protein
MLLVVVPDRPRPTTSTASPADRQQQHVVPAFERTLVPNANAQANACQCHASPHNPSVISDVPQFFDKAYY